MLTLQKETQVAESKMYILPDFSLKTLLLHKRFFLVGQAPRLNILKKKFLCCLFLTKREAKVNKNI
jgi:hypothetical protein